MSSSYRFMQYLYRKNATHKLTFFGFPGSTGGFVRGGVAEEAIIGVMGNAGTSFPLFPGGL
ncbi:hypothetical protein BCR33DRAFT_711292, partial [Rhizoclosmatium globosum]